MFKKLFIWFLLLSANAFGQALPRNIGFEEGSFNGWNYKIGTIEAYGTFQLADSNPTENRHELLKKEEVGDAVDRFGGFPKICPNGGNYTVKLGNELTGAQAESVYYIFFVPAAAVNGYSITFNYAVVFQSPNHELHEQPRFTARVYDVADGKYVDCPYLEFAASSALPGFKLSPVKSENTDPNSTVKTDVYYKDWSSATIDLSQHLGKLMRIEFITNDCTRGGHFGYAYIDVDETRSAAPVTGNEYCAGQSEITLKGPEGFYRYQWFKADNGELAGESQNLRLFPPPPDFTAYRLRVTPYPDMGCPSDFKTEIVRRAEEIKLLVHDQTGCPEKGVDLTLPAVTEGSTPGLVYSYYTDASLRSHIKDSTKVFLSGTYYIMARAEGGCADIKAVKVDLVPPDIRTSDPPPARYPATVDITKTYTPRSDLTYTYFNDAEGTSPLINYTAVNKSGTYYVRAKNTLGCEVTASVRVEVLPPLPYVVTVPNVFTPNSDGVNDALSVTLQGFIKLNSFSVFNRNGQKVFSSASVSDLWDGNFKDKPLPAGTYYWLFTGVDTYHNQSVTEKGYVTIVR